MIASVTDRKKSHRLMTLGIVGMGAFAEFAIPHLRPFFKISAFDSVRDIASMSDRLGVQPASLPGAVSCDVVMLAMPVQKLAEVVEAIRPFLRAGTLVLDVCSVKSGPVKILSGLPDNIRIVATHPLFGPQSGKAGIAGLPIALVPVREAGSCRSVARFLRQNLGLKVTVTSAEDHDRQMAYVQGLPHLISRVLLSMPNPELFLTTKAYDHLRAMVELVGCDSASLFDAICGMNPHVLGVIEEFLTTSENVTERFFGSAAVGT